MVEVGGEHSLDEALAVRNHQPIAVRPTAPAANRLDVEDLDEDRRGRVVLVVHAEDRALREGGCHDDVRGC